MGDFVSYAGSGLRLASACRPITSMSRGVRQSVWNRTGEDLTMGMEQTVTFPAGNPPSWSAARDLLASRELPVQVRMIDGELAFPDEEPPENWRELRVAAPNGMMVTVKREGDRLVLVVWGNADPGLIQAWNALTWAFAKAGKGKIDTADGLQSAAEYESRMDLSAAPSD